MHDRRSRARIRRAALLLAPVALAAGVLAVAGMGAAPGSAAAVADADPGAASELAGRLIAADHSIRVATLQLPAAEATVASTAAALDTARATQGAVAQAGPPPPDATGGGVVDIATGAILDELAPEHANASVLHAEHAAAEAVKARDELAFTLQAATNDRRAALASLRQSGQQRTWWCVALLDRLRAPVTSENLRGLFAWIGAEANAASLRNPLATTQGAPGARNANHVGVKGYPTDEIGLDATVQTLHNGHYPAILAALHRGDSALAITEAVAASPWGTGANATRRLLSGG